MWFQKSYNESCINTMPAPSIPISAQTDSQLLVLLSKGNEKAFTILYNRYHKLLYVVAYNYLKSQEKAEDITQQVFLKLWESRKVLTINVNLKNYLFTMTKNLVLNEIRNNTTIVEKNYEIAQSSPSYEDELLKKLEEKDMMKHFYDAIDQLPEQKRQVCLFKLQGNLSNLEIAEKMNISVATVKTHYSQALKMLKPHLEKLLLLLYCTVNSLFH